MTLLLAAVFGALATGTIGPLLFASAETRRHDRQIAERDEDLEEWIVTRHRLRAQRLNELRQQHHAAGVAKVRCSGPSARRREHDRPLRVP
jgi:hypothetical protein